MDCPAVQIQPGPLRYTHTVVSNLICCNVRMTETDWRSPSPGLFDYTSYLELTISEQKRSGTIQLTYGILA